ncbi:DUF72 domain-containing protein [Pseudonocardia acaciae]|uniref:DUF72 domain-containing protein n=1 Tax=Pseudonocardia acaciae TaxID=551276 RepID=UPI000A66E499|nr:DUF72 domain-containing protein [Pseudonocardia acaciae]
MYPPWRGVFYPEKLAQRRELEYLSRRLRTVEINGSFYALQRPSSYQAWYAQTPDDFVFAVKGSRFITHMKRLRAPDTLLANFFASGVLALGDKLGPVLWQLPPTFQYDPDTLAAFFDQLPRDTEAAAKLAGQHDERLEGRAWTTTDANRPLRYALEVRHASFQRDDFPELLAEHDIALVTADSAGTWPYFEQPTSRTVYLRLHGDAELYTSGYTDAALQAWAEKINNWRAAEHDVFVYFDNDVKVRAPADAMALTHLTSAAAG